MSDALQFIIELADKVSAPARAQAAALGGVEKELQAVQGAMASLEKQGAIAKALGDTGKMSTVADKLGKLGGAADLLKGQLPGVAAGGGQVSSMAEALTGQLGSAIPGAEGLTGALGELGAAAGPIGIAIAALVATLAGLGMALYAGAKLAISASDFKGDMIDSYAAMVGSAEAGKATYDQIQGIAKALPMEAEKVHSLAAKFLAQGVAENQLGDIVGAMANVQAALGKNGEEAASKIEAIITRASTSGKFAIPERALAGSGLREVEIVDAIAKKLGKGRTEIAAQLKAGTIDASVGIAAMTEALNAKFGGIAAKQLLDLDVQASKFKENATELFSDVDASPLLEALGGVGSMFDSATPAGAAMKEMITGTFNAIFKAVAVVGPYVRAFFQGLIIAALQVYIAVKPVVRTIGDVMTALTGGAPGVDVMVTLAKWAVYAGIAIAALAALVLAPFVLMIAAGPMALAALAAIVTWVEEAGSAFLAAATSIGSSIVQGIASGISSGAQFVLDAIRNLGNSATGALKSLLGIASPSKVFAQLGGHTAAGFAQGIDAGAPDVAGSMTDMAMPPPALGAAAAGGGAGGGAGGASASSGGGGGVQIGAVTITIEGVKDAADLAQRLPTELAAAFEAIGLSMGIAPAGA